jgi:hypothetical protein
MILFSTRDYLMSDFVNKRKKGIYGKRTSFCGNHEFNIEKPDLFYKEEKSIRMILYTVNQING